jgi:probable rRNA maturation factor
MIEVLYDIESPALPSVDILDKMVGAACAACAMHDISDAEVSLSCVSQSEIRELNSVHRGIDAVTDVLSFPQYDEGILDDWDGESVPVMLGDIVICTERAMAQADEYGHGVEREFVYLFVHGLLHLLGYDHENDDEKNEMRTVEEDVLRQLNMQEQ